MTMYCGEGNFIGVLTQVDILCQYRTYIPDFNFSHLILDLIGMNVRLGPCHVHVHVVRDACGGRVAPSASPRQYLMIQF
jgi:hypothetical protein